MGEDEVADATGQAVGQGRPGGVLEQRPPLPERFRQGRRRLGLDRDDLDVGRAGLDRRRHSGDSGKTDY